MEPSEPYFTWPVVASNGGYAFKFANGQYDNDIGVNNEGLQKAYNCSWYGEKYDFNADGGLRGGWSRL